MKMLSLEQCRAMIVSMRGSHLTPGPSLKGRGGRCSLDYLLFVSLLLCGGRARTWTGEDALSDVLNMPMAVYEGLRAYAISRKLTIFPFNYAGFQKAHWVNGPRLQNAIFTLTRPNPNPSLKGREKKGRGEPFGTHEVTRRLKRYARKAGLKVEDVSLRTVVNTHHFLLTVYGDADEAAEAVNLTPGPSPLGEGRIIPAAGSPAGGVQETVHWEFVDRDIRLHGIGRRSTARSL
jgi:hypothetical protein